MGKNKLKGKDLQKIDFPNNESKSLTINILSKHFKHSAKDEKLKLIQDVLLNPENYLEDSVLMPLSRAVIGKIKMKTDYEVHMLRNNGNLNLYGQKHIAHNALMQMEEAMRLPISVKGALMPDAHYGYGLPIGGVLATENAIIPFGVGLDIGCRMALSIYELPECYFKRKTFDIKKAVMKYTHFGNEGNPDTPQYHDVLDHPDFNATTHLKHLHGKAVFQLGTSGTGNHFVELGYVELHAGNQMNLPTGKYLGLLSHSGSRGMGAAIAGIYTKIAMEKCKLPNEMRSMAWLDLNDEAGQEYWVSMNLAGEFAKACHDRIHANLERALGLSSLAKVENHHNFAWKEVHDGREFIVHRKGATPAAEGEMGIIPGSMTTPGFIVSGKGNAGSLNSASHGAGRKFSRKQARESQTKSGMNKLLSENGVTLYGGSVEESPHAYKNIELVMAAQTELVNVEGTFMPKVVRMHKG
jgi:tRNA-splicing ligase RtcB